ncbi:MAG: NYN domain-containing protein [Acetivibrio sp.]
MDKENRIAVLIDAENISNKYIKLIMDEVSDFGIATYKRLYGDYKSTSVKAWMKNIQDYAITPVIQINYTQGKNASDSALIIDAMDILYSENVNVFCIVSSDSDFTKLAVRLRESGMSVIGMGEQKTPSSLVSACETFKFLDVLYKEEADEKIEKEFDIEEHKAEMETVPLEGEELNNYKANNIPNKEDIEKEVISIINARASEDGWINLAEVGINLSKRVPGFDPRNYNYSKLGQMINSYESFETKSVKNPHNNIIKVVYVKIRTRI